MSLKNVSSKSVKKGRGGGSPKKSLKKKTMSISKSGIVRNSPIKEFNNLKLKVNSVKKKSVEKLLNGLKELKEKGYSNRTMGTQEYCRYLKTHIDSRKMEKIMDLLNIKDYGYTMEEKCKAIKEKAPYIMSPRSTNLLMYLFVDTTIIVSLGLIFGVAIQSGVAPLQITGLGGALGLWIFYLSDIINYFGGTTFFLRLSRGAKSTMRHKIFKVIGEDTR